MATTPKPKKASTAYSPKPMSENDKRAAGFRGATTQWQIMLKKKDAAEAKAKLKKELKPLKSEAASTTSKVGKVANKVASTAKKVAKAEVGAAKKAVGVAKKAAEYTPAGMAVKGAKAVVKAARGGMSIKEENKKLAKTMQNIGKADKKKK